MIAVLAAQVLEPEHGVTAACGGQQIGIAVAVHIVGRNGMGSERVIIDFVVDKPGQRATVILVPGDLVIILDRRHDIHIAVHVGVSSIDRMDATRAGRNMVGRKGGRIGAIILIPGDGMVIFGCRKDVCIAVVVQIDGMDVLRAVGPPPVAVTDRATSPLPAG